MDIKNSPLPVKRALRNLGQDLRDARNRRRITMELAAERVGENIAYNQAPAYKPSIRFFPSTIIAEDFFTSSPIA